MICTGETYKNVVKMTFLKGASLEEPMHKQYGFEYSLELAPKYNYGASKGMGEKSAIDINVINWSHVECVVEIEKK